MVYEKERNQKKTHKVLRTVREVIKKIPISKIPINVEQLQSFDKNVLITGVVFDKKVLEFKKNKLYEYKITENGDSIIAKVFLTQTNLME